MNPRQNCFADLEDSLDKEDGFLTVTMVAGFFLFFAVWIAFGTFWGAILFSVTIGPTLAALLAFFVSSVGMMFAYREEDAEAGGHPRIERFFFALIPTLFSGALLIAAFLLF
jgi:hypothetical protein